MRALLITVCAFGLVATACEDTSPTSSTLTEVEQSEPSDPEDPPVLWVGGTLEEIGDRRIALREGDGPRIELERFAAGATKFFRHDGGEWVQLSDSEILDLEVGGGACIEALFDDPSFLALRIFLDAACGPG